MTGLSEELHLKCREIFSKCNQFNNHRLLSALFAVEGLVGFQNDLPEASSKEERVIITLDYLLSVESKSKRPLLIFLKVLAGYYDKKNEMHGEITSLRKYISDYFEEHNHNKVIEIPTVSIAMTLIEAKSLISGEAFNNDCVPEIARKKFDELQELLKENGVTDLLTFYGERREDWKIGCQRSGNTVENVVVNTMNCINDIYRNPIGLTPICPRFESTDFFDPYRKMETWIRLGEYGCMVIADAVSLFHPSLGGVLLQSGIVHNDRVAIFIYNPINSQSFPINAIIEQHVNDTVEIASCRFDWQLDKLFEFGLGGVRTLQRWLNAVVPDVEEFVRGERPRQSNLEYVRKKYGKSSGIGQFVISNPLSRETAAP